MKDGNAIELKNVSKAFKLEVMTDETSKILKGKRKTKTIQNVVFENINIEVKKGEILGILGRNGSGKSTLLSIMAKILEPDSGTVEVDGKVASILALSMGFHPDMSGRENVFLRGELYGFSRKEMESKVDEIIEFSGIGKYIDNPVKTYSSGMSGRLAFSIMLHVEADIMLVDEVLSTGDATFSAKASTAFKNIMRQGKTVVYVSHGISAVQEMCSRVIWIEKGKIVDEGDPKVVCPKYLTAMSESFDVIFDQAKTGVADAQYKLALMYRDGKEVEASDELYREWLKMAAGQGHASAQADYADILFESDSEEDRDEAMVLYSSAASKGNPNARSKLAAIVGGGRDDPDRLEVLEICRQLAESGHPADLARYAGALLKTAWDNDDRRLAYEKYMEAAEGCNPDVLYQIAIMRRDGVGTKRSTNGYYEMLEKAARAGHMKAINEMGSICLKGKARAPDEKEAFEWFMKGARMGNAGCQYRVACMLRDGEGVEQNKAESDRWFHIHAHSSLAGYQQSLSEIVRTRPGIDADPDELLMKAALTFHHKSVLQLASKYRSGGPGESNQERARKCYVNAAETPGAPRLSLADMYYEGVVFEQDYAKAAELYLSMPYILSTDKCFRMYQMLKDGIGVEKNEEEAQKYLKRAAARGHREARRILGMTY